MAPLLVLLVVMPSILTAVSYAYSTGQQNSILTDMLLGEMLAKMGKDLNDEPEDYRYNDRRFDSRGPMGMFSDQIDIPQVGGGESEEDVDDELVGRLTSLNLNLRDSPITSHIRDQEYLQHSPLWGHQYVAGGAGEGEQRLKPDGRIKNQQEVKTDAILPAYCNPPNPCPVGHTAEDGCLEEFDNTAAFSREYQAAQECMCDAEHMFDCPDTSNSPLQAGINQIFSELDPIHKTVAKKFNSHKPKNPYLVGEKLPIAAKKGRYSKAH